MSFLEWQDSFSVGVPSVDHEHRELIELINGFQQKISESDQLDKTLEYLGETFALISAHFALEEKLMRDAKYDRYTEHKADHEVLLDELRDIMDAVELGQTIDQDTLREKLQKWFGNHFKNEDARLHGKLG